MAKVDLAAGAAIVGVVMALRSGAPPDETALVVTGALAAYVVARCAISAVCARGATGERRPGWGMCVCVLGCARGVHVMAVPR
jgi:hypothetical protein